MQRTDPKRYEHILVALDGSQFAEKVLPYVQPLATQFGSRVTLIQVVSLLGMPVPERWQAEMAPVLAQLREDALGYLSSLATSLGESGMTVDYEAPEGEPAPVIVQRATELGADLIAMTTIGRSGIERVIFGSVADKILKTSACPILLVRASEEAGSA
jgi:nucleotide-binding universal stress UspA family protein